MLGRGLDMVQRIFHDVLMNDAQWKTMEGLFQLAHTGRVDLGDVDHELSFLITLLNLLIDLDDLNLVHGSKDGSNDSSNESQLSFDSVMINWSR